MKHIMFIVRELSRDRNIYNIIQSTQYKEYIKIYVVRLMRETEYIHQL